MKTKNIYIITFIIIIISIDNVDGYGDNVFDFNIPSSINNGELIIYKGKVKGDYSHNHNFRLYINFPKRNFTDKYLIFDYNIYISNNLKIKIFNCSEIISSY